MDTETDKHLIRLLQKGNIDAFDKLFTGYSKRIYCFAYSFLKNREDSEGIVQEVFFRVWKNRRKIDEYYSFKAFLFSISYNLIMDLFRERMRENKFLKSLYDKAEILDNKCEDDIEFNDLKNHYLKLVEKLPDRRKKIYKLSRFEGCSYAEIANKLDLSINTVENQMSAALRFLRRNLGQESLLLFLFYHLFV